MAREHFYKPIRDGSGVLRVGSSVRLLEPNVNTPISETIYVDDTGTEARANPWVAEDGVVDFYLDKPKRVDIGITPDGSTAETILPDQQVGDEDVIEETVVFTLAGVLAVSIGTLRLYFEEDCTITKVRASLGVASVGADVIVDVNRNGTSIFSTAALQPKVVAGANTGTAVPDLPAVMAEDYLTIDIDQIGATTPGSDLVVQLVRRKV